MTLVRFSRWARWFLAVTLIVLIGAQFVRADRTNPVTQPGASLLAQKSTPPAVVAILDRSCRDCHSNDTVWPWYTNIAPVSWLMAYGVTKGRDAVNFSEWAAYSPDQQRILLTVSCDDVKSGKMPGAYALLRPETRLSAQDIQTVCAAARQVNPHRAKTSQ
jgi:heme-binding protein